MVSEETNKAINLGFPEDFIGRSGYDGNLPFQSGNAIRCKSVKLDQDGLNWSIICVCENCTEMLSDVLGDSLCLRNVGEKMFLKRIDHRDRRHFGEKFGGVSGVAVDVRSSFCCSSRHCSRVFYLSAFCF